jgi:hypothetical protein
MNKGLLIVGGGVLLYWLYSRQTGTAAAPPSTAAPAGTPPPSPTPSAPAASTGQRAAIVSAINSSGVSSTFIYGQQGVDTWNWYAMQAFPGWTAPTPETLYPGEPNVHTKTYGFDDWFSRIQKYLPQVAGMSGTSRVMRSAYVGPGGWMA